MSIIWKAKASWSLMNKADYDKSEKQVQFDLHCNTRVMVKKLERTNKTEFPELIDTCTDMLRSLGNVAPSLKKELKTYEVGDELIVRVVSNKFGYILCESIDAEGKIVEQSKMVYDVPAVLLMITLTGFSMCMALIDWVYEAQNFHITF